MNAFYHTLTAAFITIIVCCYTSLKANNPEYEQRRADYVANALANPIPDAITIQAYANGVVDTVYLNNLLSGIVSGTTSDFDIVKLIRVLYYTNGTYDSEILPVLNAVPYWLTRDEAQRTYWSENHMSMWMSSDWLLHERYGRPIDATLDYRLRHFLQMKIDYGFYEFFSSVYSPFCLTGLLNLADFAQDAEIKDLATQAAQRLLKDLLMLTNDKGTFFPAAGRNYFGKYATPYGQNHNNLIYLLTGMGDIPNNTSHAGAFLATSTLPVDDIINSWVPELDIIYSNGHTLDTSFVLNSGLSHVDRIIAQWSGGAYFHPQVALESGHLVEDSNLWNHVDFAAFQSFQTLNVNDFPTLAEGAGAISKSSVIMGEEIAVFKHNSITLSSVQDFWKGKVGYQVIPVAANVGTTAVMTISGAAVEWEDRTEANENNDLPYIEQVSNVALVMYRPDPMLPFFGHNDPTVVLHWFDADFDEIRNSNYWLLGRQDESYIGVRRSCTTEINNMKACNNADGQTWVIMVGDSGMYGSFDNFQDIIDSSDFQEEWYLDSINGQWVYYASIDVDTVSIDYAWNRDTSLTGIADIDNNKSIKAFPNPSPGLINIDLSAFSGKTVTITVVNALGAEIFSKTLLHQPASPFSIDIGQWAEGMYFLSAVSDQKRITEKIIKRGK